jgi:hypothetical protein
MTRTAQGLLIGLETSTETEASIRDLKNATLTVTTFTLIEGTTTRTIGTTRTLSNAVKDPTSRGEVKDPTSREGMKSQRPV